MRYKLEKPVQGEIGLEKYQCSIEWRNGSFISDEPVRSGGKDEGPDPYTLLLSSVASCTLITLRMYIDRKGWDIPKIKVKANLFHQPKDDKQITIIDRDIEFISEVTKEQREKLVEIASACPISKIIENEVKIRTYVFSDTNEVQHLEYRNDEVTVIWKPDLCKHSGRCVTQLPEVFDIKKRPWVTIDGASADKIIEQVHRCPTGALSIK